MSEALTLARPYARAAHAVARDAGHAEAWSQSLALAARIAADPGVAVLLGDPRLRPRDARTLLADGADEAFGRFVDELADNGRLALLPEISGLYEQLRADAEQVVKARITSAAALAPAELEGLVAALRRRFGREVEVETAVDPGLIGGAVIDAGDTVIDGSLRGKLQRMQNALAN
ncbi:F0F1 ATP synthase subunit delta [Lysobacter sp. GX 14042]|uniref:F0F1 ATP synthase subunit delta n=1 Tax=Lysobacter sp. GX 14042 TaxID=2907155 RepID=UPI001F39DE1D|nr:F0F1 ATP synthase subunit delta [Lysobacter sp. GX 14042]MCE7033068.1 F0F1 ATP synthase subunit delta [Lysobacter sp. GX 14042]